jgi:protein-disulfide isomerase
MADVKANTAQVRYHPLAFLDASSSGNRYSSRAANAALCASDISVDVFVKFHNVLFTPAAQPKEGSNGRTNTQLVGYAQKAGLDPAQMTTFTTCLNGEQHKSVVQAFTDYASKHGITSTPTVLVDGKRVDATLSGVRKAIAAADVKGPAPSPSPTKSPSGSASPSVRASGTPSPSG